jgi:hypothetical protein
VLGLLAVWLFLGAQGIKFDINPNTERCLKEELSRDVLVLGNYSIELQQPSLRLHFRVRLLHRCALTPSCHALQILDPSKGEIFSKDADAAHFSFTTESGGEFQFCFNDVTDQSTLTTAFSIFGPACDLRLTLSLCLASPSQTGWPTVIPGESLLS